MRCWIIGDHTKEPTTVSTLEEFDWIMILGYDGSLGPKNPSVPGRMILPPIHTVGTARAGNLASRDDRLSDPSVKACHIYLYPARGCRVSMRRGYKSRQQEGYTCTSGGWLGAGGSTEMY
eukprot:758962-Hanusia_phi.AAC.1